MAGKIYDVAIVGAGAAGLGAAREAQERGLSYVVLEAMDRIGGRAHTDTSTFGQQWDRGCHWLHSSSVNPFRMLADEYGFRYASTNPARVSHLGDRWATPAEEVRIAAETELEHAKILEAGKRGQDVPASQVVDLDGPWISLIRTAYAGEWSVDLDQVSTADYIAYRDTHENWPVEDG